MKVNSSQQSSIAEARTKNTVRFPLRSFVNLGYAEQLLVVVLPACLPVGLLDWVTDSFSDSATKAANFQALRHCVWLSVSAVAAAAAAPTAATAATDGNPEDHDRATAEAINTNASPKSIFFPNSNMILIFHALFSLGSTLSLTPSLAGRPALCLSRSLGRSLTCGW